MPNIFTCLCLILSLQTVLFAHQPRIVTKDSVEIYNPVISQAFYATMNGKPQIYTIKSDKPFDLYVQLTLPDINGIKKDFVVDIYHNNHRLAELKGTDADWTSFYEPFGGDNYLEGPDFEKKNADTGTYTIKVTSPDNTGKYILVTGKEESFPPSEIVKTIILLPKIKRFMGESALTAYFNYTGLFILLSLLIIAAIIYVVVIIVRKIRRSRSR